MAKKTSTSAEVEALRKRLAGMRYCEVVELCERRNLSASTVQKFRMGHIADLGLGKFLALRDAVAANDANAEAR